MERIKKENKEKIMDMIKKAGSEEYETSWIDDKGKLSISKDKVRVKKGKKTKAQATRFELKVRNNLISQGRVVDKWTNNIDLDEGKIVIAKRKYNPFKKVMMIGAGFPDFISIKYIHGEFYSVIGVEAKMNGILSKIEKEKCRWYLKNKIFSSVWIAKKGEKRGEIKYENFEEKYGLE